jgi:hypothetical protein
LSRAGAWCHLFYRGLESQMNSLPWRQPAGYTLKADKIIKRLCARCARRVYKIKDFYWRGAGLMLSLPLQWQDRGSCGIGRLIRRSALLRLYVCRSASACGLLRYRRWESSDHWSSTDQVWRSGSLATFQSWPAAFGLCFSALKFSCVPRASR